jgi:hypothetical protein
MQEKKEKWGKPRFIVITRRNEQEGVLGACKSTSSSFSGYAYAFSQCKVFMDCTTICNNINPS